MILDTIDWFIIIAFLSVSLIIGIYYKTPSGSSLSDFFLGGRNLPWYIAGISMVATTFAADTPLAVAEFVAQNGISKNWIWWSFLSGGMLTTFFFAKYWRRSGVLTELELIELRYSGKEARFLRGFKAIYLGLFMNCMIISWVNLAFGTILSSFFGLDNQAVLLITFLSMLFTVAYSSLSGLLGVAITDAVQFAFAMTGTIILAIIVVNSEEVGGIENLTSNLPESYFHFFPSVNSDNALGTFSLSIGAFLSYVGIQWWASWYPGAEPGGGGYIAQRMMSTKTEKDAVYATLFFQIAHYCIRPWPWILVGLSAVYLYNPNYKMNRPELAATIIQMQNEGKTADEIKLSIPDYNDNQETQKAVDYMTSNRLGYIFAMKDFLPSGLKGLLIAAFLAAYLSTISTQLNWGASYLVNDFYLLLNKKANSESHLKYGRIATFIIMVFGLAGSQFITSISGVWEFIMECGAGLGLVLILRWYWWRINAWSEITATIAPFIGYTIGKYLIEPMMPASFIINNGSFIFTVAFTTISWIVITFLTKPTANEQLQKFFEKVQPDGAWGKFSTKKSSNLKSLFFLWIIAIVMTYSFLFAIGKIVLYQWLDAFLFSALALLSLLILIQKLRKTNIYE